MLEAQLAVKNARPQQNDEVERVKTFDELMKTPRPYSHPSIAFKKNKITVLYIIS